MLTPQEVSTHAFAKAVMGGYNMAAVDEFLDELTDDYTALYKENAALKAKMKVLVEKVEDYRATEDSMRATLLTAQKMADSIVHEAEVKRDVLLSQVESDVRTRSYQLQQELQEMEARLRQGKEELAHFIHACRSVCEQELRLLEQLPEVKVEAAPTPVVEAPAVEAEIEERVMASFQALQDVKEEPEEEVVVTEDEQVTLADSYPEGDPFADESESVTRRINLKDLKFGRNYGKDN